MALASASSRALSYADTDASSSSIIVDDAETRRRARGGSDRPPRLGAGVARGSARGAAHVGIELLLDGTLVDEPGAGPAYLAALRSAAAPRDAHGTPGTIPPDPWRNWQTQGT